MTFLYSSAYRRCPRTHRVRVRDMTTASNLSHLHSNTLHSFIRSFRRKRRQSGRRDRPGSCRSPRRATGRRCADSEVRETATTGRWWPRWNAAPEWHSAPGGWSRRGAERPSGTRDSSSRRWTDSARISCSTLCWRSVVRKSPVPLKFISVQMNHTGFIRIFGIIDTKWDFGILRNSIS